MIYDHFVYFSLISLLLIKWKVSLRFLFWIILYHIIKHLLRVKLNRKFYHRIIQRIQYNMNMVNSWSGNINETFITWKIKWLVPSIKNFLLPLNTLIGLTVYYCCVPRNDIENWKYLKQILHVLFLLFLYLQVIFRHFLPILLDYFTKLLLSWLESSYKSFLKPLILLSNMIC